MRGGNYLCDGPVNADNLDAVMDRVISRGFEHRKQVISQASSRDLALLAGSTTFGHLTICHKMIGHTKIGHI